MAARKLTRPATERDHRFFRMGYVEALENILEKIQENPQSDSDALAAAVQWIRDNR
jgi:hypothetical protein